MKVKLNILDRLLLLNFLPEKGNILTIKIRRKLRETLSLNEEELAQLDARYEYVCPWRGEKDGNRFAHCDNKGMFPEPVECAEHNVLMVPTGNFAIDPIKSGKLVKEIHLNKEATKMIKEALRQASSDEQLEEKHEKLYDMFVGKDED